MWLTGGLRAIPLCVPQRLFPLRPSRSPRAETRCASSRFTLWLARSPRPSSERMRDGPKFSFFMSAQDEDQREDAGSVVQHPGVSRERAWGEGTGSRSRGKGSPAAQQVGWMSQPAGACLRAQCVALIARTRRPPRATSLGTSAGKYSPLGSSL